MQKVNGYRFNLVIENLLFSTKDMKVTPLGKWMFQSRNRESFIFYSHIAVSGNDGPVSGFNLVIENLLFSTKKRNDEREMERISFNLVIENLLFSTL